MKRILSILVISALCLALLSTTVFAAAWQNGYGAKVEKKTDGSLTYYSATGITLSYQSPAAEISKLVMQAFGDGDDAIITISFKIRAKFVEDAVEEANVDTIIRAGAFCDEVSIEREAFDDLYEGSFFKRIDKQNVMAHNFNGHRLLITSEWTDVEIELELYREDLGIGVFEQWFLCFQNYKPLEDIEAIELTDVTVTAADEAAPKPTATQAPTATEAPNGNGNIATPTATTNSTDSSTRPVITKDPSKTLAPDSAQTVLSGKCTCNSAIPVIAIILAAVALAVSVATLVITIIGKNKK